MTSSEVCKVEEKLQLEREQLLGLLHRLDAEGRTPSHDYPQDDADYCLTTLNKESLFQQRSQVQRRLRMIDSAMRRIVEGSFGVCQMCGVDIGSRRLDVLPWAPNCLRCQELLEKEGRLEHSPTALSSAFRAAS